MCTAHRNPLKDASWVESGVIHTVLHLVLFLPHTVILHSNPTKLLVYDCSNLLTADKFHFARANPIAYYPVHCIRPLISPFSSLAPYLRGRKKSGS